MQIGINWWKSPAKSTDLNPIEKTYFHDKYKPRSLPELKEGIRVDWSKLTPELYSRYIDYLQKIMPIVVEEDGHPSGH